LNQIRSAADQGVGGDERRAQIEEMTMSNKTTHTAAAALAALTLMAGLSASTGPAEAKPKWGAFAVGLGVGALISAATHAYAFPHRCRLVDRLDHFGNYIDTVRICYRY
jgi:predicted membrane channel-forming protein YqfA (hemolysin III family)